LLRENPSGYPSSHPISKRVREEVWRAREARRRRAKWRTWEGTGSPLFLNLLPRVRRDIKRARANPDTD